MFSLVKQFLPFALLLVLTLSQPAHCKWPDTGNQKIDALLDDARYLESSKSLSLYQKALALDSKCADVYAERARYFERVGEYDKALKDCERALSLNPNEPMTHLIKARAYLQTGQYKQAIDAAEKASSIPNSFWSLDKDDLRVIGASLYHLGEYKEAILPLTTGLQHGTSPKESADAYYYRGLCYDKLGELDKAVADFDSAIKIAPDRPKYYIERARVLRKSGKIEQATADEKRSKTMKEKPHRLFYW